MACRVLALHCYSIVSLKPPRHCWRILNTHWKPDTSYKILKKDSIYPGDIGLRVPRGTPSAICLLNWAHSIHSMMKEAGNHPHFSQGVPSPPGFRTRLPMQTSSTFALGCCLKCWIQGLNFLLWSVLSGMDKTLLWRAWSQWRRLSSPPSSGGQENCQVSLFPYNALEELLDLLVKKKKSSSCWL